MQATFSHQRCSVVTAIDGCGGGCFDLDVVIPSSVAVPREQRPRTPFSIGFWNPFSVFIANRLPSVVLFIAIAERGTSATLISPWSPASFPYRDGSAAFLHRCRNL